MRSSDRVACLICGADRTVKAFSAPHDVWSRAIGWDHGATYFYCPSCTGLTQWPRMTEQDYERFYEDVQRSEATGFSDETIPDFHLELRQVTAELKWGFFESLGLGEVVPPGSRVFEVGAAEGTLLATFRDKGYEVSGIEPLDRYAAHARQELRLDVTTGYFGPGQGAAAAPNLVVVDNVLEHMPDPAETLRTIRDSLDSPGAVLVLVPNVEQALVSNANMGHNTLWSKRSLEVALTASGFSVVGIVAGRPVRRPHEWVALAVAKDGGAAAGPAPGPSLWQVRRAWLGAIHGPALKARARRWLGPAYRAGAAATRPLRTRARGPRADQ